MADRHRVSLEIVQCDENENEKVADASLAGTGRPFVLHDFT